MRRKTWIMSILAVGILVSALISGCAQKGPPGVIEGKVSVGPLNPVEQAPQPGVPAPTVPPEVFTSRHLNIYRADGKTLVKEVPYQGDGTYRVELAPGDYVVALPPGGIEYAQGLPQRVTVRSGETVQLDIDIDTGIR